MFYAIPYFELKWIYLFGHPIIRSWVIFWFIGRIVALLVFLVEAKRLNLNKKAVWIVFLSGLFLISFFEKLFFFVSHQLLHSDGWMFKFDITGWGDLRRVYFGVLVAVGLAVILGTLITKQTKNILNYLDVNLMAVVATLFFYRIGNFLWHDHIGKVTSVPWGMEYFGQVRHEISLYEILLTAALFIFVWSLRKKITRPGILAIIILIWQSFFRFSVDFLRSDDLPQSNFHFANGLTLNQVAYGILFIITSGIFLYALKKYGREMFRKNSAAK